MKKKISVSALSNSINRQCASNMSLLLSYCPSTWLKLTALFLKRNSQWPRWGLSGSVCNLHPVVFYTSILSPTLSPYRRESPVQLCFFLYLYLVQVQCIDAGCCKHFLTNLRNRTVGAYCLVYGPISATSNVPPTYWCGDGRTFRSSLRFQSFRSFQLSGHSNFQVIPAFRSFWLPGRPSHLGFSVLLSFHVNLILHTVPTVLLVLFSAWCLFVCLLITLYRAERVLFSFEMAAEFKKIKE